MSDFPSTMQDYPLTISALLRHGRDVHPDSPVHTCTDGRVTDVTDFATVADHAGRLATALHELGVRVGDRVGSFCANHREHLEAYLAVPAMGAVLHLINLRLSDEQLVFVVNDAEDTVIIVDADLLPRLEALLPQLPTVRLVICVGGGAAAASGHVDYADLVARPTPEFAWPELDERAPSGVCYTTGTTGLPKGVVYSHRSVWLHALTISSGAAFALSDRDRILQLTPLFHVNGWGLPHAAFLTGAGIVLPGRNVRSEAVAGIVEATRPTVAVSIPLIWAQLKSHHRRTPVDLSSLRTIICAGSSVPPALIDHYETTHGTDLVQGWGMTECSPWGGVSFPAAADLADPDKPWRSWSGRLLPGVEMRVIDDEGNVAPRDGATVGELEVRGPWVTGSYRGVADDNRFSPDGWLRSGDVGMIDRRGYFKITDRAKDVIKSGGEWIASVTLEDHLEGHPDVAEAAVIGIPDPRWDERPFAAVVLRQGADVTAEQLRGFLADSVPRWWLPERWSFVAELPRTSVGKLDKKRLRVLAAEGRLAVDDLDAPAAPRAVTPPIS